MALIGYKDSKNASNIIWACSGTLISDNYVLSAAHCSATPHGSAIWIRLGELDWTSTSDEATPIDFKILQRIIHPEYKPPAIYNDIAVFKFEGMSRFNDYIRPVCLNTLHKTYPTLEALGWSSVAFAPAKSPKLMTVELAIEDSSYCDDILSHFGIKFKFNDTSMICAGSVSKENEKCQGDAGGPLQAVVHNSGCSNIYKQIGIASYGGSCNFPHAAAIYTKISFYIPWIEKVVWSEAT